MNTTDNPSVSDLPDPGDREAMLDLVAAYAVHSVSDDEQEFIEAHLDDDPAYREELVRFLSTASLLTVDAPVPTATWDSVVARTRLNSTPVSGRTHGADDFGLVGPGLAKVIALDAARAARRSRLRIAVGAAAASALIAVPVTLQFVGGSSPSLAALATKAAGQRGTRTISLKDSRGVALADVVVTADGRGFLRRDSLPQLPTGRAYQLWAITGGNPVSAGVLGRNPSVMAFTLDAPTTAMALSVEPAAGSTQPTTTPIAQGTFA